MSATCGGRLRENFGDLGLRTAWAGRKIVEFFGTHLQGSVSTGKGVPTVAKPLPVVNSSTSRFLQRAIVFFKGYSTFLSGGPKVPFPASHPQMRREAGGFFLLRKGGVVLVAPNDTINT